jgi:integrase
MPSTRQIIHITQANVDALPFAETSAGFRVRDDKVAAFQIRIGRFTKTYRVETERSVNGRRQAISRALGTHPTMKASEARAAAMTILGQRKDLGPGKRKATTLETAAADHFAALTRNSLADGKDGRWSKESARSYRLHLSHWAKRSLASLSDAPDEVAKWFDKVTDRAGPSAANHAARVLKAIYIRAQRLNRHLPAMPPTSGIERYNAEEARDSAIPFDQFPIWAAQVQAIEATNKLRAAYHRTLIYTGMRPSEGAKLRWRSVDPKKRTITVKRSKTGKDITIPLSWQIARELRRARDAAAEMFDGDLAQEWVFAAHSESGHLETWIERHHRLDWVGNSGRHSYRTIAADLGIDSLQSRTLMGHSTRGIHDRYASRNLLVGSSLRRAQARISRRIVELMRGDRGAVKNRDS